MRQPGLTPNRQKSISDTVPPAFRSPAPPVPPFDSTLSAFNPRSHSQGRQKDMSSYRSSYHQVINTSPAPRGHYVRVGDLGDIQRGRSFRQHSLLLLTLLHSLVLDEQRVDVLLTGGLETHRTCLGSHCTFVVALPTRWIEQYQKRCPQRVNTGRCALWPQAKQLKACKGSRNSSSFICQLQALYSMSAEIILSAKQVEIDESKMATLHLKATFNTTQPMAALYKVRTNSKEFVDVRPSFGVLWNTNDDDAVGPMNIRYTGRPEDIKKIKLQISWVWGTLPAQIKSKKLTHTQFVEHYAAFKEKIGSEKTHTLLFEVKSELRKFQSLTFNQEAGREEDASEVEAIHIKEKGGIDNVTTTSQNPTVLVMPQQPQKQKKGKQITLKTILIALLIAFALGVYTGIKIQDYRLSLTAATESQTLTSDAESEAVVSVAGRQAQQNQVEGQDNSSRELIVDGSKQPFQYIENDELGRRLLDAIQKAQISEEKYGYEENPSTTETL